MNPEEISALVEASLAGPREVHVHSSQDASEYMASIRKRFMEKRVTPDLRAVRIEPHIVHLVELPEGNHTVFFVTDDSPNSVFYDLHTKSFGCAWGPDAAGIYVDLGFRSHDVLAMASA